MITGQRRSRRPRVQAATVVCLLLVWPTVAFADGVFTPFIGASFGPGDTERVSTWGVSLASMAGGVFGFEIDFSRTAEATDSSVFVDNSRVTQVTGNIIIGVPIKAVRPYVVGGVGWVRTEINAVDLSLADQTDGLGATVGAGLMGFFSDHVGARVDLRYLRGASVGGSLTEFELDKVGFWRAAVGLALRF